MTVFVPLALSGASASAGSAAFARLLLTPFSIAGASASSGTITVTQALVSGAFDDFSLVPLAAGADYSDPVITGVTGTTVRIAPSDTVNAWQRISITASAPTDYAPGPTGKLYNRAAYAKLTVNSDAMPISSNQYLTYLQFEKTPGGKDAYSDRTGINLLSLDQSSYEGRLYYQAATLDGGERFVRTNSLASCGLWSGLYTYNAPPVANTYANVQRWGSYAAARAANATYSALTYNVPPGSPPGVSGGQSVFTVNPMPEAWARVQAGTFLVGQLALALPTAGVTIGATLIQYDVNGAVLSSTNSATLTSLGSLQWQTVTMSLTLNASAYFAAIVPRVTTGSAVQTMTYYVDEHRLYVPTNRNQGAVGTSPARAWQPPRQIIIRPRATRVNLCQNPAFYNDLAGWVAQAPAGITPVYTRGLTTGLTGGPCADFSLTSVPPASLLGSGAVPWTGLGTRANISVATLVAIDLVPAGTQVTYSAYVRPIHSPVPITIWADNGTTLVRGTSTPIQDASHVTPPWARISVTVTTNTDYGGAATVNVGYAASDVQAIFTAVIPGTNPLIWQALGTTGTGSRGLWTATTTYNSLDTVNDAAGNLYLALVANGPYSTISSMEFRLDNVLAEVGGQLQPYFDGFSTSPDYLWETPTDTRPATGETRSHYYQGKTTTQYRLDRAIQRALPVGASYQIVYASPPS